ncbi:hypothetical protein DIZ31_26500 [Escherichia coli]|nr:hypothetical protein DIZ31_26500 [Escherichia coli]
MCVFKKEYEKRRQTLSLGRVVRLMFEGCAHHQQLHRVGGRRRQMVIRGRGIATRANSPRTRTTHAPASSSSTVWLPVGAGASTTVPYTHFRSHELKENTAFWPMPEKDILQVTLLQSCKTKYVVT